MMFLAERRYFFFGAIATFLLLSCAKAPSELLLDSFEGTISHETVDFGASEGSSLSVSASRDFKACGEQSIKLDYYLKPSGYMWAARGYNLDVKGAAKWLVKPQEVVWRRYNAFALSMYGRASGAVIAFDIKDRGGEVWRFLLDDDFSGEREITCHFKDFFARKDWQPDGAEINGRLDFPIMSFQFEPRLPGKGIYYFDCVKLVRR